MKRSYHQFCGVAKALDVIGDRWTLLLVRDLILGGRRYTDLLNGLPGLTTNLLARRLRAMTEAGLIEQRELPPPAASTVYELTDRGRELEPVIFALGRFGEAYLAEIEDEHRSIRWAMVSWMRRFGGTDRAGVLELRPGVHVFWAEMTPDTLRIHDGAAARAQVVISGDIMGFVELMRGGDPERLLQDARLSVEGDQELYRALALGIQVREGLSPPESK